MPVALWWLSVFSIKSPVPTFQKHGSIDVLTPLMLREAWDWPPVVDGGDVHATFRLEHSMADF